MAKNYHKATTEEPQVAQIDIGALLQKGRQERQLEVAAVARQINLSADIIEKLENNLFSDIGPAVYVRGYLGLYARYLGIDATYFISLYDTQYPATDISIKPTVAQRRAGMQKSQKHSKTLSFLLAGSVFAALMYAYAGVEPFIFKQSPPPSESVTAKNSLSETLDATKNVNNLADDVLNGLPISNPQASSTDLALSLPLPDTIIQLESSPPPADSGESATTETDTPAADTATASKTAADKSQQQTAKPSALSMRFNDDCWIKITDAKGKVIAAKTYKKGKKLSTKGYLPITIAVARSGAISALQLDGKAVKLADYKVGNIKYELK